MTKVTTVGGFSRTCLVVDIYTIDPMTPIQLAQLEDQIGLVVAKFQAIEQADVVGPTRFITPLKNALRL
jgi:hypothetical protein